MTTNFLSPLFNGSQILDDAGVVITGGAELWTYAAGTTTPIATYTTLTGTATNANPLVAQSNGRFATEIWFAETDVVKFVLKDAEGSDIAGGTFDNISGVNDISASSSSAGEWINTGLTPSYISSTQFNVVGNQTILFGVGQRVKYVCSGGTLYGTVSVVAYSSSTTVTIVPDGAGLDSGLSTVFTSIITAINTGVDAGGVSYKSAIAYASLTVGKALQDQQAEIVALQDAPVGSPPTPIGAIVMWANATLPFGWLECDGAAISGTYTDLIALIGANVPDMRGYFPRGWDHGRGIDTGRALGSAQDFAGQDALGYWGVDDRIQDGHLAIGTMSASAATTAEAVAAGAPAADTTAEGGDGRTCYARFKLSDSSGFKAAAENRPYNLALMFIIKATNASP